MKKQLLDLTNRYFNTYDIRIDIDVLYPQLSRYNLSLKEVEQLYESICKNMMFFKNNLNYPLQVSNLLFFEIDSRDLKLNTFRGSQHRNELILEYREILKQNK